MNRIKQFYLAKAEAELDESFSELRLYCENKLKTILEQKETICFGEYTIEIPTVVLFSAEEQASFNIKNYQITKKVEIDTECLKIHYLLEKNYDGCYIINDEFKNRVRL